MREASLWRAGRVTPGTSSSEPRAINGSLDRAARTGSRRSTDSNVAVARDRGYACLRSIGALRRRSFASLSVPPE